jgi:alpha-galactosidase
MPSPKITFIGAGSTVFAKALIGDILAFPELARSRLVLFDIDPERLATTEKVAHRVAATLGAAPVIESTTDRARALDGATYAINMIQVGGYRPCTVTDFEVPKRHGLERLCPDVLHLNYTNPMAMNCWGLARLSRIRTVGLCHSVPYTAQELAADLAIPVEEIDYLVAGINHMAFYLKFEHKGEDLYPRLQELAAQGRVPRWNRVRYEMLRRLGYFVTESSEHFSEYVPWFIKRGRPDLIERFNIPLDEYPRRCERQIAEWGELRQKLEDPNEPIGVKRSVEYGSLIILSQETGRPAVIYGNVPNRGVIDNLPQDCIVEVPCLVDKNGVQPVKVGAIPPHLAALMQTNINVQALAVEAAVTGKREHVHHAAMLDPHTAAELDLDQIWALVDELLAAHRDWLPATLGGGARPKAA